MLVDLLVPVEDFIEGFLLADFNDIVIFGQKVDNPDLPCFLSKSSNTSALFLPPRRLEIVFPSGIWLQRRNVQVPALRTEVPEDICLSVDRSKGLFGLLVKPVGDVLACHLDQGL